MSHGIAALLECLGCISITIDIFREDLILVPHLFIIIFIHFIQLCVPTSGRRKMIDYADCVFKLFRKQPTGMANGTQTTLKHVEKLLTLSNQLV